MLILNAIEKSEIRVPSNKGNPAEILPYVIPYNTAGMFVNRVTNILVNAFVRSSNQYMSFLGDIPLPQEIKSSNNIGAIQAHITQVCSKGADADASVGFINQQVKIYHHVSIVSTSNILFISKTWPDYLKSQAAQSITKQPEGVKMISAAIFTGESLTNIVDCVALVLGLQYIFQYTPRPFPQNIHEINPHIFIAVNSVLEHYYAIINNIGKYIGYYDLAGGRDKQAWYVPLDAFYVLIRETAQNTLTRTDVYAYKDTPMSGDVDVMFGKGAPKMDDALLELIIKTRSEPIHPLMLLPATHTTTAQLAVKLRTYLNTPYVPVPSIPAVQGKPYYGGPKMQPGSTTGPVHTNGPDGGVFIQGKLYYGGSKMPPPPIMQAQGGTVRGSQGPTVVNFKITADTLNLSQTAKAVAGSPNTYLLSGTNVTLNEISPTGWTSNFSNFTGGSYSRGGCSGRNCGGGCGGGGCGGGCARNSSENDVLEMNAQVRRARNRAISEYYYPYTPPGECPY